jgi:adenosylcobinamide kinase/adenosylcobinamide-phosphate guanylyltransferase
MAGIILVTGGSRSGKSDYARKRGEALAAPRAFVATCPVVDEETAERIRRHREERSSLLWDTLEEPLDLETVIQSATTYRVILVDCLTLWINNLLFQGEQEGKTFSEDDMIARTRDLISACFAIPGTVILVTNEVGWGIVPENPLARRYRDLVGRCNTTVAAQADEVVLVTAGIPLALKTSE